MFVWGGARIPRLLFGIVFQNGFQRIHRRFIDFIQNLANQNNTFWANWNQNNGILWPSQNKSFWDRKCRKSSDCRTETRTSSTDWWTQHQIHKWALRSISFPHFDAESGKDEPHLWIFLFLILTAVCFSFVRDYYCYWNLRKICFCWTAYRMRFELELKCIPQSELSFLCDSNRQPKWKKQLRNQTIKKYDFDFYDIYKFVFCSDWFRWNCILFLLFFYLLDSTNLAYSNNLMVYWTIIKRMHKIDQ